ncbi:MAG: hypothetical protein R2720_14155 [Candidatus Nanopelagicales bacterium]
MVTNGVGTLREKPLHAALKQWCSREGDLFEQPVDGFVIDIVRPGLLIEIQTRSFSSMRRKLTRLLENHSVRVVHPIAVDQWIVKVDEQTGVMSRRLSPKHGRPVDIFAELVAFPDLVADPGLTVEILLVRTEQQRRFEAGKAWRRRGWVIEENRLLEVVDRVVIESAENLIQLLPPLPEIFTTSDLAAAMHCSRRLAQQATFCLRKSGELQVVGKRGRALEYRRI